MAQQRRYRRSAHLRAHIVPCLGNTVLTDINTRTVQRFVMQLSREKRSVKTVRNILQTLTSILDWARKLAYQTGEFRREDIEVLGRESRKPRFLDAKEMAAIIANAKEPYATMFAALAMTAIRSGEMLGLQVLDLDFERKLIHVRRSLDSRTWELQPTKTESS